LSTVGVVAHTGKSIGGGLPELRRVLARKGINDPLWYEVSKSRQAPKKVRRALAKGADVIFAWGGDGLAQRCIDTLAGTNATLAIVPAGTSNLLASNLGIPGAIPAAVEVGLSGIRRRIDVGTVNGECFAVMAGVGFDARMIDTTDATLKDALGRIAYLWTGARSLRSPSFNARVKVDGSSWYRGSASCILLGNVGRLFGGIEVFEQARPDDGLLEVGVVSADGVIDWARTIARTVAGSPEASPFVHTNRARTVKIKLSRKMLYELDGGARTKTRRLKIKVHPAAITIATPATAATTPNTQNLAAVPAG
jgi:YegS/Rv2252/BmrU family lipid kinase